MDPSYIAAIKKALSKKNVDAADLERVAELAQHTLGDESKASAKFVRPPRSQGGVNVNGLVIDVAARGSKQKYSVLIWQDFAKTVVEKEAGRKVDMYRLDLNIIKEVKMTPEEKQRHDQECDAKKDANGKKRQYNKVDGGTVSLHTGSIITVSPFETAGYTISKRPVRTGDLVILTALTPKMRFDHPDATFAKYGMQWWLPEPDKGGMQADMQHSIDDVLKALDNTIVHNEIVNVGTNGCRSEHNETPGDRDQRLALGAASAGWEKEIVIEGQLPQDKRHILSKALVIPLEETPITPEGAAGNQEVLLSAPIWSDSFVGESGEGESKKSWCEAKFTTEANLFDDEGAAITAKVQVQLRRDHISRFGIVDIENWSKLAPILVQHARGLIVAHIWAANSEAMPESQIERNERNEDGTYPMGYAFGCYYMSDVVHVDLPATLLNAGFEITPDCAARIVESKYGTTDFIRKTPEDVKLCVEDEHNYLRTLDDKPVINLFESRNRFDDLREEYVFVLLADKDKNHEDVVDIVDELKIEAEKEGSDWLELQDALILGERKARGWPLSIKDDKLVYTVFAIRKDLVDEARRPREQMPPEEFAERYAVALQKRKEREVVQSEIAALRGMDAAVFFDRPNPGSPVAPGSPADPDGTLDSPGNPGSPEQKPKRRKTRSKK